MAHAEDLAYLAEKFADGRFEDWCADLAADLRKLDEEGGNANLELGRLDVKRGKVLDVWRQPRPIRYRSKSA